MDFKDRQGQNLNRKKIKIISQSPTEIIADIERYDTVTEEGNLINAEVFNTFQKEIDQANTNASSALNISSEASNNINDAKDYASEALIKAKNAIADSKKAIDLATETANSLADRGTSVYVGNEAKASIQFDADPQTQLNTKLNKNFNTLTTKQILSDNDTFAIQDYNTQENLNVTLATIKSTLLNASFPLGAIYMSVNSTNPSELFGGVWEALENRFLLGASSSYPVGSTGGEVNHTLTISEMPTHNHENSLTFEISQEPHSHGIRSSSNYSTNCNGLARGGDENKGGYYQVGGVANNNGEEFYCYKAGDEIEYIKPENAEIDFQKTTLYNANAGGGNPHNNMPPYLAVYMWKRIG